MDGRSGSAQPARQDRGALAGAEPPATLRRLLERYVQVSDDAWRDFTALLRPRSLRRGAHFARAGDTVRTLGFVVEGILRRYHPAEDGETTTGFLAEHSFVTDVASLCSGARCESSLQALTPVRLLCIDLAGLREMADRHPAWNDFAPAAGLALVRRRERAHIELLSRSPELRYHDLLDACPRLMERVQHYHVASYLGVTPESLSRLRRRIDSRTPREPAGGA